MSEKKAFFLSRLNEHLQYMGDVEKSLNGDCEFQGCEFNHCQLGQWLYGAGTEEVLSLKNNRALKMFNRLFDVHKKFHEAGDQALLQKRRGYSEISSQCLSDMQLFCSQLITILLALDDIVNASNTAVGVEHNDTILKGVA